MGHPWLDFAGQGAGLPAPPWKAYVRNSVVFRKLADLRQRLTALERKPD